MKDRKDIKDMTLGDINSLLEEAKEIIENQDTLIESQNATINRQKEENSHMVKLLEKTQKCLQKEYNDKII